MLTAYLMCESKKSMSACQIQRTIKVSYKTAWYLCHRIRAAMKDAGADLLSGTVEVDETYVGGKVRGKGRGYRGNKAMVLAAVQRGGAVRFAVEKHADRATLHGFIRKHTAPETDRIVTDELPAYAGIADKDTTHETVNHSAEEWVRGDVHTNTVEGVFSLFKRSIIGAHHRLSVKHLPAYLDEHAFRFNNRRNPYLFRDTILKLIGAETLPYQRLVTG
jgi:transposase-like protein